jgi:hypothetical protein
MPVLRDVRDALRLLARTPGSTLLTVLVLAGGLGISTFAFSFLHTASARWSGGSSQATIGRGAPAASEASSADRSATSRGSPDR